MAKILVTGATGNIGRKTLQHLLERRPAGDLVGLARDPSKAADLAQKGIEIREGDYFSYDGLVHAFEGIEKIMLVSATAFTDRDTQHANVIEAARQAGVGHIVFMPIIRRAGSTFTLPQVTREDEFAVEKLKASGLAYTLVRHPPFLENIETYAGGDPLQAGVHVPAGAGKAAYSSRDNLAEAHAVVLSEAGHENKDYSLYGSPPVSFQDVAQILSDISAGRVSFTEISDEDYIARLEAAGLPDPYAHFLLAWVHGVAAGEWEGHTGDLERLIGRKPTTAAEHLRANYQVREEPPRGGRARDAAITE